MRFAVIIAAVCFSLSVSLGNGYKVVCYYTNWAQYRKQPFAFTPESIDPSLCTHINYAFAKIVGNNLHPYESNDDTQGGMYSRIMKVKQSNPHIKVLLSVGGWTHGPGPFSAVARSDQSIHTFAKNALNYLRQRKFDGLDIDWEYPGSRGSPAGDKQKFTKFLQIIKDTFSAEATQTGNPRLLLTAAVAAGKSTIDKAYEIRKISAILDFVNLMAYDLHGDWESTAGENSPLYPLNTEHGDQRTMNQDWAVNYWIHQGCPSEKLIMGLGTYGRSLQLSSQSQHQPNDRINGPGLMGSILQENGFLSYYEICQKLKAGYTEKWDADQDVPYAYHTTDWIGYDDVRSFEIKANYIKSHHLGGAMVWAIDLDDFVNICGHGKFPLMNTLKRILLGNNSPSHQNPTTHITSKHLLQSKTTMPPTSAKVTKGQTVHGTTHAVHRTTHAVHRTTHAASPGQKCKPQLPTHCDHDIYPDLCDCRNYYVCDDRGQGKIVFRDHVCNKDTVFDVKHQYCNWISEVGLDACK